MSTLVVTNDFPPRVGGIEGFVHQACALLNDDVVVLTSHTPGDQLHDERQAYEVIRHSRLLVPTPSTARMMRGLIRDRGITRVLFGAAAPLALLAGAAKEAGARHVLALSHGHEVWWSMLPGTRSLLGRIAARVDHLGYISQFTGDRLRRALPATVGDRLIRIPPPVDLARFRPAAEPEPGLVVAAGRLVTRKGFAALLQWWPGVVEALSGGPVTPRLEIIGDGPQHAHLQRLARQLPRVSLAPAVPHHQMPARLARAAVFVMPVRTRLGGLDPEGLGMVAAEAAACGVPVLVGRSGGAPETVVPGRTGYVIDACHAGLWQHRLVELLSDPGRAAALGRSGREFVARRFGADAVGATIRRCVGLP